jgi:hypothetical protein
MSYSLSLVNSIIDVGKSEIALLDKQPIQLSFDYLSAFEKGSPTNQTYKYVFVKEKSVVIGMFYFQIIDLASKELEHIINLEPYSKLLSSISGLINNMLFGVKKNKKHVLLINGNLTISGEYGIAFLKDKKYAVMQQLSAALDFVKNEIEHQDKIIASIIKDFPSDEIEEIDTLVPPNRYSRMMMDPIMKISIRADWNSMDDYLEDLSAKYRLRYNNTRKKLDGLQTRILSYEEIEREKDQINILYANVQQKSPIRIVKTDVNYLLSLSKHLGDNFVFKAIYKNEIMICFLCGFYDKNHFEAHHIGINYQYNKQHALYHNILFEFIDLGISLKRNEISFGRTAMEMKTTVGAIPADYHAFIRLHNRVLNSIIRPFIPKKAETNWTPRSPFKN